LLGALGRPAPLADCERVFGFGYLLTEWMLPDALCDELHRRQVALLGARANFIVTVFDHLLDESVSGRPPLSARDVQRAVAGDLRPLSIASLVGPPARRLLARLARSYFKAFAALPFASRHSGVRRLVSRAITSMYAAEIQTASMRDPGEQTLRRKAALPFVVMGAAAWLAVPEFSPALFRAHLRWLYRVGDLLSAIDDLADLPADIAASRPNRLTAVFNGSGYMAPDDLSRRIVGAALKIVESRHATASCRRRGDVFGAIIISWFGGQGSMAVVENRSALHP
jgi:hypothetical protein